LLQFVGVNLCRQPNTASLLPHVNQNAVAFLLDLPKGCVQLISTIASARTENVAGQTLAVHANQRRFVLVDLTLHKREVVPAIAIRSIHMQIAIAVLGWTFYEFFQLHELFTNPAMSDQAFD